MAVNEPDDADGSYVRSDVAIVYEYVPFGTENVIVPDVDDSLVPLSVTDHDVPDGNPVSVNVTVYLLTDVVVGVNVTA